MRDDVPGALLLEDGTLYEGLGFGHISTIAGEVVFNTSMTGYQEILTDPSYRAQIVTMTYPHIGNCGVNPADIESRRVQVAGFVVRVLCMRPSNWRSSGSLDAYLRHNRVPGISDIDTRALVRRIRGEGVMRGALMVGEISRAALEARIAAEPSMVGRDLVSEVTCDGPYEWSEGLMRLHGELRTRPRPQASEGQYRVVAYDFGVKRNILRMLVDHGCDVTVVPASTPAAEVLDRQPDGVFLSNGPGDPSAVGYAVDNIRELIGAVPLFGICLGHQLLGLALGGRTYKLKFGHRGANQPVLDAKAGRVEITSQNHGFALASEGLAPGTVITHTNLNDGTVEGLADPVRRLFSVQYHPESSPGPHDADYLFRRFAELMDAV